MLRFGEPVGRDAIAAEVQPHTKSLFASHANAAISKPRSGDAVLTAVPWVPPEAGRCSSQDQPPTRWKR